MIYKMILLALFAILPGFLYAVPAGQDSAIGLTNAVVEMDSIVQHAPQAVKEDSGLFTPDPSAGNSPSVIGILMFAVFFGFLFSFLRRRK